MYLDPLYKKHILTRPQVLNRYKEYLNSEKIQLGDFTLYGPNTNTHFDPIENLDLEKSISYLQKAYNYKQILIECGISTTKQYYEGDPIIHNEKDDTYSLQCPFDSVLLSIFRGYIDPSCIGPLYPTLSDVSDRFNIVHHSKEQETEDGSWVMTFWQRKSVAEQIKIREIAQLCENEDESVYAEYHRKQMEKREQSDEIKAKKSEKYSKTAKDQDPKNKASRFIDVTTGEYKYDQELGEESKFASRSPIFNRKKYPYLSEKEFTTKRPKV